MAISGLITVLFLLIHMYGDLNVFNGRAAFDDYARCLWTMGEPFLPYSGALWITWVVLLASVLVHIYAAVTLRKRARRATAGPPSSARPPVASCHLRRSHRTPPARPST
ncbi:hypothetical protein [Streptomyces griseofuscus]|uniref:hypothetical protein n=2 Tax=Streptomyces TaxID=1883 RepID=UPI0026BF72F0